MDNQIPFHGRGDQQCPPTAVWVYLTPERWRRSLLMTPLACIVNLMTPLAFIMNEMPGRFWIIKAHRLRCRWGTRRLRRGQRLLARASITSRLALVHRESMPRHKRWGRVTPGKRLGLAHPRVSFQMAELGGLGANSARVRRVGVS